MLYYFLVVLWAAHITLFWLGNIKKSKEMIMFAVILALFTTYSPVLPGVEVVRSDGTVAAIRDPVSAFASFIVMMVYAVKLVRMGFEEGSRGLKAMQPNWRWLK